MLKSFVSLTAFATSHEVYSVCPQILYKLQLLHFDVSTDPIHFWSGAIKGNQIVGLVLIGVITVPITVFVFLASEVLFVNKTVAKKFTGKLTKMKSGNTCFCGYSL